jgi:hypothetical protein
MTAEMGHGVLKPTTIPTSEYRPLATLTPALDWPGGRRRDQGPMPRVMGSERRLMFPGEAISAEQIREGGSPRSVPRLFGADGFFLYPETEVA